MAAVLAAYDLLAAERRRLRSWGFRRAARWLYTSRASGLLLARCLLAPFLAIRYSGLVPVPPGRIRAPGLCDADLPRRAGGDDPEMRGLPRPQRYRTFNVDAALVPWN